MGLSGKSGRVFFQYALAAALATGLAYASLAMWLARPEVPLRLEYDATFYAFAAKATLDHGWIYPNDRVGAPFGQDLRDFPQCDHLHLMACRALGWIFDDFGTVLNVYYLLGFPAVAASMLWVLRRLKLAAVPALVASVLYALLPMHMLRYYHVFPMAYYLVPLMAWLILRVADDVPPFYAAGPDGKPKLRLGSRSAVGATVLIALMVTSGPYYTYFGAALLAIFAVLVSIRGRRRQPMVSAGLMLLVAAIVGAINLLPYALHYFEHGFNLGSPRWGKEVEDLGLKIAGLLLPVPGHLIPALAELRKEYARWGGLHGSWSTPLGLFGSIGFLFLLGRLVLRALPGKSPSGDDPPGRDRLLGKLSVLSLSGLLVATVGGFSSLVALAGFIMIRRYDQMSVYIGFFCFTASAVLLDRLWRRWRASGRKPAAAIVMGAVLLFAAADQTSLWAIPKYREFHDEWDSDRAFVADLELLLPTDAMVFQLPVVRFLGTVDQGKMRDYDPIISYLHSDSLRWSYGAVPGRYGSAWQAWLDRLPVEHRLQTICRAGFAGLTVDRMGYVGDARHEQSPEREIARVLDAAPVVSVNGRLAFYDLREYAKRFPPPAADDAAAARTTYPVLHTFTGGFVKTEADADDTSRWCYTCGLIQLHVPPDRSAVEVELEMVLWSEHEEPSTLRIRGKSVHDYVEITDTPFVHRMIVSAPAGETVLRFDVISGEAQEDPQKPTFRLERFRLTELAPATRPAPADR